MNAETLTALIAAGVAVACAGGCAVLLRQAHRALDDALTALGLAQDAAGEAEGHAQDARIAAGDAEAMAKDALESADEARDCALPS